MRTTKNMLILHCLLLLLLSLSSLSPVPVTAAAAAAGSFGTTDVGVLLRRLLVSRGLQTNRRFRNGGDNHALASLSLSNSGKRLCGTTLSFRKPTPERCSQWFGNEDSGDFNHDSAGMTNPSLDIMVDNEVVVHVNQHKEVTWWPKQPTDDRTTQPSKKQRQWRVLCYRSRVGFGRDCYERCRDAALAWDFSTPQLGIVSAAPYNDPDYGGGSGGATAAAARIYQTTNGCGYHSVRTIAAETPSPFRSTANALCICSGQGRRMATYTEAFSSRVLPKLYVVNPVRLVYELVDARCRGTTYSSSAYATLKGHWIRGEERVTVALRDDGNVDVEILSYSKPGNTIMGKLVWPFIGPRQSSFFRQQLEAIENVALPTGDVPEQFPSPIQPVPLQ